MFKKTLSIIFTLALTACAANKPQPVIIAPEVTVNKDLVNVLKVEVNDLRKQNPLAFVNGKAKPMNKDLIPNLELWLQQSIDTNPYGSKVMSINLLSYASYIKQETMTFTIESVLEWQIKVESEQKTWVKSYQSTINEEGPLTADNSIIEKHLNKLASQLLERSLSDQEFEQIVNFVTPVSQ